MKKIFATILSVALLISTTVFSGCQNSEPALSESREQSGVEYSDSQDSPESSESHHTEPEKDDAEPTAPAQTEPVKDDTEPTAPVQTEPVKDDTEPTTPAQTEPVNNSHEDETFRGDPQTAITTVLPDGCRWTPTEEYPNAYTDSSGTLWHNTKGETETPDNREDANNSDPNDGNTSVEPSDNHGIELPIVFD